MLAHTCICIYHSNTWLDSESMVASRIRKCICIFGAAVIARLERASSDHMPPQKGYPSMPSKHLFIYNQHIKHKQPSKKHPPHTSHTNTNIDSEGSMIIWSVFKWESERPVRISPRDSNTITSSNYTFLTVNLKPHLMEGINSCRDIQSSNIHHGIGSSLLFSEKTNQIQSLDSLSRSINRDMVWYPASCIPQTDTNGIESALLRLLVPRSLSSCITIGVVWPPDGENYQRDTNKYK